PSVLGSSSRTYDRTPASYAPRAPPPERAIASRGCRVGPNSASLSGEDRPPGKEAGTRKSCPAPRGGAKRGRGRELGEGANELKRDIQQQAGSGRSILRHSRPGQ